MWPTPDGQTHAPDWVRSASDVQITRLIVDLVSELGRRSAAASTRRPLEASEVRPALLTADDLAATLGVPKARIYALQRERRLPVVRIGGQVRFEPEAIEAWIQQGGCG